MTSSKYFYLDHILLAIIHTTAVELSITVKTTVLLTATMLTLPFMQCEVQSGYSEHACLFIDQKLLAPVRSAETIRQHQYAQAYYASLILNIIDL